MTKRTALIPALVAGVVLACVAALLAVSAKEAGAAFPGQNGRLVYSTEKQAESDTMQIYTINPDGTGKKQLTFTSPVHHNTDPEFSADGKKIAWQRGSDVWVMNRDGSGKRRLVVDAEQPAFSPDGRKVAFARRDPEEGDWEIYWRALDGTRTERVTDNLGVDSNPVWSPDGKKIAYEFAKVVVDGCLGCVDYMDIFTISPDGSGKRRLTDLPDQTSAYDPNWGPGGRTVLFMGVDNSDPEGRQSFRTVKADGTGLRTILFPSGDSPVFSPDGTRIAFISQSDGGPNVITADRDAGGQDNVTDTVFGEWGYYGGLDWGPRPTTAP